MVDSHFQHREDHGGRPGVFCTAPLKLWYAAPVHPTTTDTTHHRSLSVAVDLTHIC